MRAGKPFAAGRSDVVVPEHTQRFEADDAREHGDRPECEGEHGQDVGRGPRRLGDREDLPRHAEQGDECGGEDEVGDRLHEAGRAGEGDLGPAVPPVLGEDRHPQPERVGDDDREDEGRPDESQGVRQPVADDLADGLPGDDRRAEVTRQGVAHVLHVLLGQRSVEPEVVAPCRDQLGLGGDPAQGGPHGIAGDRVDHRERQRDQHEQAGEQPRHPPDDERRPRVSTPPCRSRGSYRDSLIAGGLLDSR